MEQENVCWSSSEVERLMEQMKNEIQADEKKDVAEQDREQETSPNLCSLTETIKQVERAVSEGAGLCELEEELQLEEEIKLMYE